MMYEWCALWVWLSEEGMFLESELPPPCLIWRLTRCGVNAC